MEEIEQLYTEDALEMLGKWPNTWCVIMEEDECEAEDGGVPVLTFDSHADYLNWQRSLLPALILRGRAWTA